MQKKHKIFLRPLRFYVRFTTAIHTEPDNKSDSIRLVPMGSFVTIEYVEDNWGKLIEENGFINMDYTTIA